MLNLLLRPFQGLEQSDQVSAVFSAGISTVFNGIQATLAISIESSGRRHLLTPRRAWPLRERTAVCYTAFPVVLLELYVSISNLAPKTLLRLSIGRVLWSPR